MPRPILVALDDSPRAQMVLGAATALARSQKTSLILIHVVSPPISMPSEALLVSPVDLEGILLDDAQKQLTTLRNDLTQGLDAKTLAVLGMPWQAICEKAKECDASTIVLGSHGYDGFDRVLGTTAQKVVNNADRNVLVVRSDPPWKKIVCALDGSARTRAVFDAAVALGMQFQSELVLTRAISVPKLPARVLPKDMSLASLMANAAKKHLTELANEAREEVKVRTLVNVGDAREVIEQVTKSEKASIVVIGAHGYSLGERFLGTTAGWVVNHSTASVLVVREAP